MEIIKLNNFDFVSMCMNSYVLKKDTIYVVQDKDTIYMLVGDGETTINDAVKTPLISNKNNDNPFSEVVNIDNDTPSNISLVSTSKLKETEELIMKQVNKTIENLQSTYQLQLNNIKDTIIKEIKDQIVENIIIYIEQLLQKNNNTNNKILNIVEEIINKHANQVAVDNVLGHVWVSNDINTCNEYAVLSSGAVQKTIEKIHKDIFDISSTIHEELEDIKENHNRNVSNLYNKKNELMEKYDNLLKEVKQYKDLLEKINISINSSSGAVSGVFGKVEKDILYIPSLKINSKGICVGSSHIKIKIKNMEVID